MWFLLKLFTWPLEVFARATNWCGYNDTHPVDDRYNQATRDAKTAEMKKAADAAWEEQKRKAHERQGK